VVFNQDFYKI